MRSGRETVLSAAGRRTLRGHDRGWWLAEDPELNARLGALTDALDAERSRRHGVEEALRQSEERAAHLIEGVKDYAIFTMDPRGRIVTWNEGARRLLGYEPEEALGQPCALTFTDEDRRAGRPERELQTAQSTGSAMDENWAVRKDGSRFWASGVTTALRDPIGHHSGFIKIFRDLTERRRAEEALRDNERRLRVALAAARMGTWLWNIPTNEDRLDESLRRLLDIPEGEDVHTFEDFLGKVHPEDRPAVAAAFDDAVRQGKSLNVEFRVVWRDGSVHWLRDQGDVIADAQGRPVQLAGACVDITERKQMEEALRRAHDELEKRVAERTAELLRVQQRVLQAERLATIGQVVAGIAHESRNALQTIQANLERLSWRLEGQPAALALLGEIQKAQDTLQRLLEDVRSYAAPIKLDRARHNLGNVWRDAWLDVLARHPGRDAGLLEETAGISLEGDVDAFRIGQVFGNAFDNALAACPDPVRVTVRCADTTLGDRPAVRIALRDNGPGLSAEQAEKIFEPFFTTKTRGTGLGMAIAKRVVEAHGGDLRVGEHAGPGAEIVITLPRRRL